MNNNHIRPCWNKYFKEKSKLDEGWINGGFFVLETDVFDYIEGDHMPWEDEPLKRITNENQLNSYKHIICCKIQLIKTPIKIKAYTGCIQRHLKRIQNIYLTDILINK